MRKPIVPPSAEDEERAARPENAEDRSAFASGGEYMQIKESKLRSQFAAHVPQETSILRGVCVYIDGLTDPPASVLRTLLYKHGGSFEQYYRRSLCTHIVAQNLPDRKIQQILDSRDPVPVVLPDWIVSCDRERTRLPYSYFLLPLMHPAEQSTLRNWVKPVQLMSVRERTLPSDEGSGAGVGERAGGTGSTADAHAQRAQHHGVDDDGRPTGDVRAAAFRSVPAYEGPGVPSGNRSELAVHLACPATERASGANASASHESGPRDGWSPERHGGARVAYDKSQDSAAACGATDASAQRFPLNVCTLSPASALSKAANADSASALAGAGTAPRAPNRAERDRGNSAPHCRTEHSHAYVAEDPPCEKDNVRRCEQGVRFSAGAETLRASGDSGPSGLARVAPACGVQPPPASRLSEQRPVPSPVPAPVDSEVGGATGTASDQPLRESGIDSTASEGREDVHGARPPRFPPVPLAPAPEEPHAPAAPRGENMTTEDDPNFLARYLASSRLHFIGSWRAHLQGFLADLAQRGELPAPHLSTEEQEMFLSSKERTILHVDMDCFFVSVVTRHRRDLDGKPVAVAHSGGDSAEISSCNYEARSAGVRAGMWMGRARSLCPQLRVVPYDFAAYRHVAEHMYKLFFAHAPLVQPVSCDEAYLDVTGLGDGVVIAKRLRALLRRDVQCPASAGVGSSMLLARLATAAAKPDGVKAFLTAAQGAAYVRASPLRSIPGVGHAARRALGERGVSDGEGALRLGRTALLELLGTAKGAALWETLHGRDDRALRPLEPLQSVGTVVGWGVRFSDEARAEAFVGEVAREVARRLQSLGAAARAITVHIRRRAPGAQQPRKFLGHGVVTNAGRSAQFGVPTADTARVESAAVRLYRALRCPVLELRGVGVVAAQLVYNARETASLAELLHSTRTGSNEGAQSAGPSPASADATGSGAPRQHAGGGVAAVAETGARGAAAVAGRTATGWRVDVGEWAGGAAMRTWSAPLQRMKESGNSNQAAERRTSPHVGNRTSERGSVSDEDVWNSSEEEQSAGDDFRLDPSPLRGERGGVPPVRSQLFERNVAMGVEECGTLPLRDGTTMEKGSVMHAGEMRDEEPFAAAAPASQSAQRAGSGEYGGDDHASAQAEGGAEDDALPPYSQVDPAVLAELPGDVRDQIVAAYRRRLRSSHGATSESPQARRSHSVHDTLIGVHGTREASAGDPCEDAARTAVGSPVRAKRLAVATRRLFPRVGPSAPEAEEPTREPQTSWVPAFSQLDQDALGALPSQLRAEVVDEARRVSSRRGIQRRRSTEQPPLRAGRSGQARGEELDIACGRHPCFVEPLRDRRKNDEGVEMAPVGSLSCVTLPKPRPAPMLDTICADEGPALLREILEDHYEGDEDVARLALEICAQAAAQFVYRGRLDIVAGILFDMDQVRSSTCAAEGAVDRAIDYIQNLVIASRGAPLRFRKRRSG